MRQKQKKKTNWYPLITVILAISFGIGFYVKTTYFTAKEVIVELDDVKKTTISTSSNIELAKDASSTEKNLNYRKNWKDFIYIPPLHKDVEFTITEDGSVINLNIPIVNKTEYPIESLTIKVFYINPSNRNTVDSKEFEIKNVQPNNRISFKGPESNSKGVTVICDIIKARSNNFNFCFDQDLMKDSQVKGGFSGDPNDPWHCK
ncbi:MAG: hypothetical protein B7Y15_04110 [Bacteroidetes bacterium 24-39-8]|jgi:hypothetical protein|nr:MAG: hypothetical protein B7Y69_01210 [Sphingobacteriia bacterium 35-40-8]OYZ51988.1 MAG: hypothetical protein B7Y15_04110 [Bacteroidetes bacterium 24-39-8]OZA66553.1 MAG: hypothetical protein B7X72_06040 [Sphingobacteriia bacterium 39-39-8]HQR91841.1 hypothetical protein [Sediminibacterium sp.]HQS56283.1 hypothetical protein [Sediminibacterium sp.]